MSVVVPMYAPVSGLLVRLSGKTCMFGVINFVLTGNTSGVNVCNALLI